MRTPWWLTAYASLGVLALLSGSVFRLMKPVLDLSNYEVVWWQWALVVPWCVFMVYAEAYKGFHKQFCPRVVTRSWSMPGDKPWLWIVAPFVATGLLHATRKRRIISTVLILGITLLVMVIRSLPQPWRGLIDVGVVMGLGGGALSLAYHMTRAAMGTLPEADPEWPEPA